MHGCVYVQWACELRVMFVCVWRGGRRRFTEACDLHCEHRFRLRTRVLPTAGYSETICNTCLPNSHPDAVLGGWDQSDRARPIPWVYLLYLMPRQAFMAWCWCAARGRGGGG